MSILHTLICTGLFAVCCSLAAAQQVPTGDATHPIIIMQTNKGPIILKLDAEKAPVSTKNFLAYIQSGFYDSTLIHRVIPGFVIQGGGLEASNMSRKATRSPIVNESGNGLPNKRGSISMARTSELNSATSQFFINLVDNKQLDQGQYAVFGEVVVGMETVDAIAKVATTTSGGYENIPVEKVIIQSVKVSK